MNVVNQTVENTGGTSQITACNTSLGLYINTTYTTDVLLTLSCQQAVEQLVLNHVPLDRITARSIQITDILALEFLHGTPLHLQHHIVNVAALVLDLHAALIDFSCLPCLADFTEEGIEDNVVILNTIANREEVGHLTGSEHTGDDGILTANSELSSHITQVVNTLIVGRELTLSQSFDIGHAVLYQILHTLHQRDAVLAGCLIELTLIFLRGFTQSSSCCRVGCNLVPTQVHGVHRCLGTEQILGSIAETVQAYDNSRALLGGLILGGTLSHLTHLGTQCVDGVDDTLLGGRFFLLLLGSGSLLTTGGDNSCIDVVQQLLLLSVLSLSRFSVDVILQRHLVVTLVGFAYLLELLVGQSFLVELTGEA